MHYEKFQDGTVKCIEDEIPFELPEGWCWVRLGVLAQYKKGSFGSSITKAMFVPDSPDAIKIYEQKNAINKDATLGTYFISSEKYKELKDFEVFHNDIIVSCAGTIGETYVLPKEMRKGIINQALMKISLYDISLLDFYLMYFDFQLKRTAQEQGHGIALKNIPPFDVLKKYLVPIPPLQEQQRLMEKIHYLSSLVDSLDADSIAIFNLVRITKSKILDLAIRGQLVPQDPNDEPASVLLERIRAEKEELIIQGKLKRDKKESVIFRGDDNSYYEKIGDKTENIDDQIPFELPDGWAFIRLKSAWKLISGRDLSPSEYNNESNGFPYITGASNFENGQITLVRWTPVPQVLTHKGDLLLTCKGTIGEIALNNFGEAHIARQTMAIRNIYNLNVEFLALYIEYSMAEIKQAAKGLIPGISRGDILNLILPIPPEEHQKKIVRCVQTRLKKLNAIFQALS